MGVNTGYLTANAHADGDEMYTPYYCVTPLVKYINKNLTVWCPFDKAWSAFVKTFTANGNTVIHTHIDDGQNFFTYEPSHYDVIISNPPFSKKDDVIKRLYELQKPFAVLLPMNSLQGVKRFRYFKQGVQLLCFDQRVGFHSADDMQDPVEGSPFASAYFCKGVLPDNLIIEHIDKYSKPLVQ